HELLLQESLRELDPPGVEQALDELCRVQDGEATAELGILVLDRVEAVRALRDDPVELVAVEGLDVHLREREVEILVAQAARRLAGALLLHAENAELDACRLHDLDQGATGLLIAVVE